MPQILTKAIDDFYSGTFKLGVEAFEVEIIRIIKDAGLLEENVVYTVRKVGIHPDNREQEMAQLAEVHDLLDCMVQDGFNPKGWNAMASTIPPGREGDRWRAKNFELAENSKGLVTQSASGRTRR